MGDPRPMGGQSIPTPKFRVVPGSDDNRMSPYNRPQRLNMRPNIDNNNQYMYPHDNNNFQRPNAIPHRMQYPVRPGIPPIQRMQQMNLNQRMSPSMMMPPPHQQLQQQQPNRPQMQQQPQSDTSDQVNKEKLIRLFKSFCGLCNKTNKSNIPNLLHLIERYIRGEIDVTEFLQNITSFTNFAPQNNLQSFLELNIGLIRGDLESGRLSVEHFLPSRISVTEAGSSPQSMHASTASPQSHPGPSPGPRPTSSGPSPMQKILNEPPNSEPHPRMLVNYSPINQPPASASSFDPGHRGSISESTSSNSPNMFVQSSSSIASILPPPTVTTISSQASSSSSFPTFTPPVVPEKRIKLESAESLPAPTVPVVESKAAQKVDEAPSNISTTENAADVAFKEISSEQGDVEKCIFDRKAFAARLQKKMPECSAFEEQVLTMLSSFLETKIRSVLDKAYEAAEHRLEQLRVNPAFSQKDDPKMQLRVLEKHEKMEQQKRADVEKEAILKLSKGKAKDSDMLEKAKKIKKADEEAALNREANEAAIAALGSKKRKWQTAKDSGNPSSSQASSSRSRVKQVTMRDLMFVFERDQFAQNTLLYRKMLYGLIPNGDNNTKQP